MRQWMLWSTLLWSCAFYAQHSLKARVLSTEGTPIPKAHIDLSNLCTITDEKGYFVIENIISQKYTLRIEKEGYHPFINSLFIEKDLEDTYYLLEESEEDLEEIIITSRHQSTQNKEIVTQQDVYKNYSGSLATSLSNIAGLDAITIGTQNAKPTMRGLGFNRLAVVENGIKQEGQQWGADHGLEIDALQSEQIEIIKGVSAIEYGSDAIAGVVKINNESLPQLGTNIQTLFTFNSNNLSLGNSWNIGHRKDNHFYKIKASYIDYADFRVPTKEINYLNTRIPIHQGVMTNTAGKEISYSAQWGYIQDEFKGILTLSQFQSKSGFFSGAHGIPSIEKTLPDGNQRNIKHPLQKVWHTKINYHAQWSLLHSIWDFKTSYQRNHRQEESAFHTHYPNQKKPEKNPDLELDFLLNTWDTHLSYQYDWGANHKSKIEISNQYQDNSSGGYSYLLPKFRRNNWGLFAKHQWYLQNDKLLDIGARIDYAKVNVEGYYDSVLFDYLYQKGYSTEESNKYAQRSISLNKDFLRANFSMGYTFHTEKNIHNSVSLGSHFRFPNTMELSANGIHHGAFRHEEGNPQLEVERGWVLDWNMKYSTNKTKINSSAFAYYFGNYIFLKPSGIFSPLPHGGQIYQYSQSQALITGFEWDISYQWKQWSLQCIVEYLYNQQLGNKANYPLPFTTPINGIWNVFYKPKDYKGLQNQEWNLQIKGALAQNRIAQNEETTPGYFTLGVQYSSQWNLGKTIPYFHIGVQNILNTKYYLHNSFYRAIDIPATGRTIYCLIKIPF